MIDYGVKAPTETIIKNKLKLAGLATIVDGEFLLAEGVAYDFIGKIILQEAVYDIDEETILTPSIRSEDVYANVRLFGDDAEDLETKLKSKVKAQSKDDDEGAPAIGGTSDGFKIYPFELIHSPSRVWA